MRFLSAWRLLFLLVPFALAIAYLVMQRRRRTLATRFTSVDLLASVAPRFTGWQRHIPAAALLVALVLSVVGFARPADTVRVPKESSTVILALDVSASMGATDVEPTRLAAAQTAARTFIERLPPTTLLGLVTFDRQARLLVAPTADRAQAIAAIDGLKLGPGTATGDAIDTSLTAAQSSAPTTGGTSSAVVVLMSDGTPTIGRGGLTAAQTLDEAIANAKAQGVPISTISYGTQDGTVKAEGQTIRVPADPDAMKKIADDTGGKTFSAETADQLESVYDKISTSVSFDIQTRELTAWFTGAALLTTVLAAMAALRWTQRIL